MRQGRKGFLFLYDAFTWVVLGLVFVSFITVSLYYLNREREQVSSVRKELQVKTFADQILYFVPQTKTVSLSSDADTVTLTLFNGCQVSLTYNPDTKEISYQSNCPSGQSVSVPGGKVKVDSFSAQSTTYGVKLTVCRGSSCYEYFLRGM